MARTRKGKVENGHSGEEESQESRQRRLFVSLTQRVDSAKARADDARGELGGLYAQAESDGYHRRALKEALRLRDMEPDKLRDYLTNLNRYCDWLGVFDQGELLDPIPRPPQPVNGAERRADADAEAHELAASSDQPTGGYRGLAQFIAQGQAAQQAADGIIADAQQGPRRRGRKRKEAVPEGG